jgi:hypothetical protein
MSFDMFFYGTYISSSLLQRKGKQISRTVKRLAPAELASSLLKRAPETVERLAQFDHMEYVDYDAYGSPSLRLTKVGTVSHHIEIISCYYFIGMLANPLLVHTLI